ncbi:MAG: hypothetical protein E2O36_03330 [Proteobacteria bacterium]|nr:MAG: hypothetical protein E2O36_03330 [Pseudomonadota bacterium]
MDNLAEISLDLICALKFAPPGGYEAEDIAAMENACWQTILHSLERDERAAILTVAVRHIEELELEPAASLPQYLQQKLSALKDLVAEHAECANLE